MKTYIIVLILTCFTAVGWTAEYKVFWRCGDKHLEALDPHINNDQKVNLFLNYFNEGTNKLLSSPINLKSLVQLPGEFNSSNFLALSKGQQIFMNCIGQVTLRPHDIQGKVVFDVLRNSYGCPFIPKRCSG
ncbi:hypothetical protein [Legionella jamestowniensis]|uniref:Uncharacterized protein n=1 Tax=Legionella jamestowniensis TaxID=455 RepID=A0A0W0UU23_9GAMM|nr:hypothetical protein [Legionella jamestowniensis]KTD11271.1 hypothetical protein Ljam_0465 [Legionella jamestowniensis]OCH98126.1 hypothetical protein A8135_13280 [Legionella jamestowniensis]SFL69705.1 hypothetical protein SAMN02746073_1449 [Legionella jamestowniensis DSM 19215]